MEGEYNESIPRWLANEEFQATVLLGLTCVGAWVIFSWVIKLIFSIVWPFFAVVTLLVLTPHWRKAITRDLLPKYKDTLQYYLRRWTSGHNT